MTTPTEAERMAALPELPHLGSLIPPEQQRDIEQMLREYALAYGAALEKENAELREKVEASRLISVDERLPDCQYECTTTGTMISRTVLLFGADDAYRGSHGYGHLQDDGKWVCYEGEYDEMNVTKVTHWMPLPMPVSKAGGQP